MAKTMKQVMDKAIKYVGTKEVPANSNNVKFNTDYYGHPVSGAAYPWCCAYVWDVFRLANSSDIFFNGEKTAYCPTVESWGKQKNLTVNKLNGKKGDIVLFDFNNKGIAGHIGFIIANNGDGSYKTLEGNTGVGNDANGGCVMYRTRYVSQIRCIIRPKYKKAATPVVTKPSVANPTLRLHSVGSHVKYLQADLNYIMGSGLTIDGEFGTATEKAVKAFQKKYKLTVDGIYGVKSRTKVAELLK